MGCGNSSANFQKFSQSHEFQKWSEAFEALQISRNDLYRFYKVFGKVDLDGGGTIDLVEMLTVIDVERTPFTERVFSIFDDDKSGKIDFGEFVLALWNYNTLTRVSLGIFDIIV
jgi:Ca2+-binding EF-hand superfamily protein